MREKIIIVMLLFIIYSSVAVAQVDENTLAQERLAQWNISYASYLIDVGKYLDALDAYNTAFEVTPYKQTRLKVLLYKANLLATFLDAEDQALDIYNEIIIKYPEGKEIALYRKGLLLFDMGKYKDSSAVFKEYLKEFPEGRYKYQSEALLGQALTMVKPPEVKPEIKKAPPIIRVLLLRKIHSVKCIGKDLVINGTPTTKDELLITSSSYDGKQLVIESSIPIKVISGDYKKRVRGKIIIKPYKGDKLMVLNVLDIESYLWGVVPSESYPSWPLETLKAQAVAARTYAYYQILHRKNWSYDVVDNAGDQAYKGVDRETKRTTQAVNETRGMVLIEKNRPILAMFTANNGGYTADASYIFKLNKEYLVAKPDPLSLKGKMAKWKRSYTIRDVEKRLRAIGLPVKGLKEIVPTKRGPSGRIVKIKIVSNSITKEYRTRTTLRRALGLPEILFKIEKQGNTLIFKGKGWGHGVGYSQWGGAIMGEKGYNFKEILKFYYPGTTLKTLW